MPAQGTGRRRFGAATLSALAHVPVLAALGLGATHASAPPEPQPVVVTLVETTVVRPQPDPEPDPAPDPQPAAASPAPPTRTRPEPARRATPRVVADALPAPAAAQHVQARASGSGLGVSEADLAGAARAGSGHGGSCDMGGRLQAALRRDPMVRAAVADASGQAILVWNGDWVQSGGEDGKGLAAVREAVMWEVAFAPPACRTAPVRGLILISMNEAAGSARLVLGHSHWRWSDLLGRGQAGAVR